MLQTHIVLAASYGLLGDPGLSMLPMTILIL